MKNSIDVDFSILAIVLLMIFFWGEPDLLDSLIAYLQFLAGN